jgi:uncharacterized lipoprotein YajG
MQRLSINSFLKFVFLLAASGMLSACADKPGSEGWCEALGREK